MNETLLIIDDHASLRRNLAAMLEDEGFSVLEAESAESALLALSDRPVAVAIVDMRLPGMDGSEFIRLAAERHPALRFIIHTGSVDFQLSPALLAQYISEADLFYKPIADIQGFIQRLRFLCQSP